MAHAASCVKRLVDILLGKGAAAINKLVHGPTLVILGVRVALSQRGFTFCPAEEKAWGVR